MGKPKISMEEKTHQQNQIQFFLWLVESPYVKLLRVTPVSRVSLWTNRLSIVKGIVDIRQGSVTRLPYADEQFNLVTSFETIQFWPDISNNPDEVSRVLKSPGTFLIANRYPAADSKK